MKVVKNYLNSAHDFKCSDNLFQGISEFSMSNPSVLTSANYSIENQLNSIRKKEIRWNSGKYAIYNEKNNIVDFSTYDNGDGIPFTFRSGPTSKDYENQTGIQIDNLQAKMNARSSVVNNYLITEAGGYITISADNVFSFNNSSASYFRILGFTASSYSGSNTYTSEEVYWSRAKNYIYLDLSLVPNKAINSVVLLWGDKADIGLTSSAVVKLKAYTLPLPSMSAPDFETTITIDLNKPFSSKYFATQTYSYWVLEIDDHTNNNKVNLGKLVLGTSIEIQDPDIGFTYSIKDNSNKNLNNYNIEFVNITSFQRSINFNLSLMSWTDAEALHNLYKEVGSRYNIFFELDETDTLYSSEVFSMWCKINNTLSYANKVRDIFDGSISIYEVN